MLVSNYIYDCQTLLQIWEETTVFTELHVNTDEPDSGATNHSTPKQPKQQSQ